MFGIRLITLALMFSAAVNAAAKDKETTYDGPCEPITSFVRSRQPSAGPDESLQKQVSFTCSLPKTARLNFLIATVPNPIDTHLALWFDRAVESVVDAAGSVGFRFQGAWVPWDADLVRAETDPFKRKQIEDEHDYRKKQFGVLLFRTGSPCPQVGPPAKCQDADLAVLLVPETPTEGIAADVFHDAVRVISRFHPSSSKIPMMGPSFSGSFDSLAKIMQASKDN